MQRAKKTLTFDDVREIALALPDTEEGTAYGSPAVKVDGQMFACIPVHASAEPSSLAVRIPFAERDDLVAADPETYYFTSHYADYPSVLVRLSAIRVGALRDLLLMAHKFVAQKSTSGRRRKLTRSARPRR